MEVFGINPFQQKGAAAGESELFFRGGRRQELLQYIRHLSSSLYDLVIVVGPSGIGKSSMLNALQRQLTDDLVDLDCVDAKAYVNADNVQALSIELSKRLNLGEFGQIANDPIGAISYQPDGESIKPLICIDHVEAWSEELFTQFFSNWVNDVVTSRVRADKLSNKKEEDGGLSLPVKCLLWVDQSWLDGLKKSGQARQLLDAGYVVKVGPLNRVDVQKYLEYKLNLVGAGRFKFSKKEMNEIYRRSKGIPSEIDKAAEGLFYRRVYRKSSVWSLFPKSHAAALICVLFGLIWLSYIEDNGAEIDQNQLSREESQPFAPALEEATFSGYSEVVQEPLESAVEGEHQVEKSEASEVLVGLVNESTEVVSVQESVAVLADTLVEMGDTAEVEEPLKEPEGAVIEVIESEVPELKALTFEAPRSKTPKPEDMGEIEKAEVINSDSIFRQHTDYYTVQLLAGRDLGAIEHRKGQLTAVYDGEVTHFEALVKGRPWYVLVAGVYENRSDAVAASKSISAKAQFAWSKNVSKPWVRQIKSVID